MDTAARSRSPAPEPTADALTQMRTEAGQAPKYSRWARINERLARH